MCKAITPNQNTNVFKGIKNHLFFYKRFSLTEVFEKLNYRNGNESKEVFEGENIKMNSLRLHTFKEKGCVCVSCGRVGTHFRLQKTKKDINYHFGLYSDDEIEMSKDHIVPKSKGGLDSLNNMQTMCVICNSKKGNSYTAEDVLKGEYLDKSKLNEKGEGQTNFNDKKEKIVYPTFNIKDIIEKYPNLLEHKNKIEGYMKKNHKNPYKENISEELNESVKYVKEYYYKIIERHNGIISLRNKKIIGIPYELRKEIIMEVLNKKSI